LFSLVLKTASFFITFALDFVLHLFLVELRFAYKMRFDRKVDMTLLSIHSFSFTFLSQILFALEFLILFASAIKFIAD
jgi:hypothetical protein